MSYVTVTETAGLGQVVAAPHIASLEEQLRALRSQRGAKWHEMTRLPFADPRRRTLRAEISALDRRIRELQRRLAAERRRAAAEARRRAARAKREKIMASPAYMAVRRIKPTIKVSRLPGWAKRRIYRVFDDVVSRI